MTILENPHLRRAFVERVKPGRPHTEDVLRTIDGLAEVGNRLAAHSQKFEGDRNLTSVGRQSKLAELARGQLAKEYAKASVRARRAPAYIEGQKKALGLPPIDKSDVAATMRRLEIRQFLTNLPPQQRLAAAREFSKDLSLAAALFEQPAILSGLDDGSLHMPGAEIFEGLRKDVLQALHGPKLAALEEQSDDYSAAVGMASAIRHQIYQASGLSQEGFEALMRPLEAEADGPPPAPAPSASLKPYEIDDTAFRADVDRIWNEGIAKAIAETRAEMFGNSGGVN